MNTLVLINLGYVAAAVLFIVGLKMLSSPATARRGNILSSLGMLVAVVVTLLGEGIVEYQWVVVGLVTGGASACWRHVW